MGGVVNRKATKDLRLGKLGGKLRSVGKAAARPRLRGPVEFSFLHSVKVELNESITVIVENKLLTEIK